MWVPFFRRDLLSTIALEMAMSQSWETPIIWRMCLIMRIPIKLEFQWNIWRFTMRFWALLLPNGVFSTPISVMGFTRSVTPRPLYLSPEICAKGMCFDSFGQKGGPNFRGKPSWLGPSTFRNTLWLCQNSYWKWPFIVDFPIKNGDFQ